MAIVHPRPHYRLERKALREGFVAIAGVDEAGCAPLAGPVVAAAVILDPKRTPRGINDFRAGLGLAPAHRLFIEWLPSPQLVVALFPEWFASKQPDWPAQTRLTGFPLFDEPDLSPISPELSRFLDDDEPPIAFTPVSPPSATVSRYLIFPVATPRLPAV